ncbi:GC-rich sequence DNA-binding factor 2, partial [Durusdinium trenchii]
VGEDGAFNELLLAALERLRVCLRQFAPVFFATKEVFVPAHLVSSWYASPVRKIAACAAHLEGRVADEQLAPLVLQEIFALRMAPHLQGPRLHLEEMDLLERFIEALPERWLDPLPAALSPLRDCLGPRAPKNAELSAERAYRLLQKMK